MKTLNKEDTLVLKGIGICMIFLHNYFNLIKPTTGINEFSYNSVFVDKFLFLMQTDAINSIKHLFTYFGHYGVQLFIFCSGYGLAIKHMNKEINYKKFIYKRLYKLYPVYTLAFIMLLIYQYVIFNNVFTYKTLGAVIAKYTLISNLIPDTMFSICGPYWFFSMIIQLYLFFPLLIIMHKKNKYSLYLIVLISYVIIILFNPYLSSANLSFYSSASFTNFSLYYNFLGNLPVFILGILLATNSKNQHYILVSILSLCVFVLGQFYELFWYFTQIAFIGLLMPVFAFLKGLRPSNYLKRSFLYLGKISMYLFFVHGFLRFPWVDYLNETHSTSLQYVFLLFFIAISFIAAMLLKKLEKKLLVLLHSKFPILLTL